MNLYLLYWLISLIFIVYLLLIKKKSIFISDIFLILVGIIFETLIIQFDFIEIKTTFSLNLFGLPDWLLLIWLIFILVNDEFIKLIEIFKKFKSIIYTFGATLSYVAAEKFNILKLNSNLTILFYFSFWWIFFLLSEYFKNKRSIDNGVKNET